MLTFLFETVEAAKSLFYFSQSASATPPFLDPLSLHPVAWPSSLYLPDQSAVQEHFKKEDDGKPFTIRNSFDSSILSITSVCVSIKAFVCFKLTRFYDTCLNGHTERWSKRLLSNRRVLIPAHYLLTYCQSAFASYPDMQDTLWRPCLLSFSKTYFIRFR